ncbi:sensor histidine kinase [Marilutibacter chinensis]|uniref:histidine kinase n=1 Tax=Marilutibacter chinensis TaxID=2912247 RepID=A0ABS9HRU6_9GAMM|nr:histidine kinase [Lysobacter chinensis]MCF7221246.1 histidine kinase [Lysobacter chinensis]MCF7223013.1 histidine kinase [Lysobacter chinensis]
MPTSAPTDMRAGTTYPLDAALPPKVLVGGNTVWSRYRQYPVFSLPWLRGRSLLFAIVLALFALVAGFGMGLSTRDYEVGVLSGGHLFVAFMLMATAGPALATWVRYRRWPATRERRAVVLAVLVGIAISFAVDQWASGYVEREVVTAMQEAGQRVSGKPDLSGFERGLALAVNLAVLLVIYGLFGGGLALRAYFSEQRRWEQERHQVEVARLRRLKHDSDLRLGALQAQVEPHFLFNTLASVRALVRQDPLQAEQTLDALVDYLRATIPRLRNGDAGSAGLESTLGQQLDLCAAYLEVMRLRMGGRLVYRIDAEPALRGRAYPPLLLITLVENAIKHGIEPKRGGGEVVVSARVADGMLDVEVRDDGVGLRPGIGSGVGLENVREQLRARYGGRAALRLQAAPGGGTVAGIRIPAAEAA